MDTETRIVDPLKLENQLCFPLYACSKGIVAKYKPFLDELGLTYTQYITMMVMWEHKTMNVTKLGKLLFLDSGTLTPLLKRLEEKKFIKRTRSTEDERQMVLSITQEGETLREKAAGVPSKMGACIQITPEEAQFLYQILYKLLNQVNC